MIRDGYNMKNKYKVIAPKCCVYTVRKSCEFIEECRVVIHFDTTERPVLGRHPMVHGQVSTEDRRLYKGRCKVLKMSTVMQDRNLLFIQDRVECICTSVEVFLKYYDRENKKNVGLLCIVVFYNTNELNMHRNMCHWGFILILQGLLPLWDEQICEPFRVIVK